MGAWGVGIFDNDFALDVKGEVDRCLRAGMSVEDATDAVRAELAYHFMDEGPRPDAWLALAALQLEHGTLQDDVRGEALRIIENGEALKWWLGNNADETIEQRRRGDELIEQRRVVLAEFRERLTA